MRQALKLCLVAWLLWSGAASAQYSLTVGGSEGPIYVSAGDVVTFTVEAEGCPNGARYWRDDWLANGTLFSRAYYIDSPCEASPFTFSAEFSQPGAYTIRYESLWCSQRFFIRCQTLPNQWRVNEAPEIEVIVGPAAPIDHFRIEHDGSGLTCAPEAVLVRACANADCSELYTQPVQLTLSPGGWEGGENKVLTGGSGVFDFRRTSVGSSTLGIASAVPPAANPTRCFENGVEGDCTLAFADSGFLFGEAGNGFEVPDQVSARPSGPIALRAVKADPSDPQSCAPAFTGSREVNFWFAYSNPGSGSQALNLNATALATTAPGRAFTLNFDSNGVASIALEYADAGQLTLNALYQGSGDEAGLTLSGNSAFVVRPDAFCVDSTTATWPCDPLSPNCSLLAAAGEDFPLRVRAVQWDASGAAACERSTTPNYQGSVDLTATLLAPSPGVPGGLAQPSVTISAGGEAVLNQQYSEVGAISVSADSQGAYLGSAPVSGQSAAMGRFGPARFELSELAPGELTPACSGFSYVAQPIEHNQPAQVQIQAVNAAGDPLRNYEGLWASLGTGTIESEHATGLDPLAGNLSFQFTRNEALSTVSEGLATLSLDGELVYERLDSVPGASFAGGITHTVLVADRDTSDNVPSDFQIDARFPPGEDTLYWGRMELASAYGPETAALPMPLFISRFDGSAWVLNSADSCTSLAVDALQLTDEAGSVSTDATASVGGGSTTVSILQSPASGGRIDLQFSAPGAGNTGSVLVEPLLEPAEADLQHLQFDWDGDGVFDNPVGQATFGIYRGEEGVIDRREQN